jgi:hypothetical protein
VFEHLAVNARNVVRRATDEARFRGDRRVGTDHILLALLADSFGTEVIGVGLAEGRESARSLDLRALEAIGVPSAGLYPHDAVRTAGYLPFSAGARDILRRTVQLSAAERARQIGIRHLLAAVLEREGPDPAMAMLAELGVDRKLARERLAAA